MDVLIPANIVNCNVINDCIEKYEEIKDTHSPILQLIAENEISEFDFSLIGHFILFKEECPKLTIKVILKNNYTNVDTTSNIIWKLRQQMVHAYYSTDKDIFTLIDGNNTMIQASIDEDREGRFELSSKFLPITYLNEKNYSSLFQTPINFIPLTSLELKEKTDEESLYQACRRKLIKQISKFHYLNNLSQLAFYYALKSAKMLRYYLYDELDTDTQKKILKSGNKKDFQVGTNKNLDDNINYWKKLTPMFNEIKETSLFCVMLFFTFISSDVVRKNGKKSSLVQEAATIKRLWEFTKELAYGINELAKNIDQHSGYKKGIITGFVNRNNELELSVFDHGNKGIMKTFMDYLSEKKRLAENQDVQDDINAIRDRHFDFKSFFTANCILNEQANRATAHLGLLFFSKLIEDNNKNSLITTPLKVISTNKDYGTNAYPDESVKQELPDIGTYYKITLSLDNDREYKPYKPVEIPREKYINKNNSTDFFKFKFIRDDYVSINKSIHYFKLSPINIIDRLSETELWEHFSSSIKRKSNIKIISIDFSDVELNASQLFRFIANFELSFPHIQLIVFNVKTQEIIDLQAINDSYFEKRQNVSIDYWNKDKATLIYSFVEIDMHKFYFTDILWGKTKDEFYFGIVNLLYIFHYSVYKIKDSRKH